MAELPRLNGVIRALEQGQTALAAFSPAEIDSALTFSTSSYDAIVFEMEHNPWDARTLRDCLQYMLNQLRQIVDAGSIARPALLRLYEFHRTAMKKTNGWPSKRSIWARTESYGRTSAPWSRPTMP